MALSILRNYYLGRMRIREANSGDISGMQIVRNLVKENPLSNPALVTDQDCDDFINKRGKGWVCEDDGEIIGSVVKKISRDIAFAFQESFIEYRRLR